MTSSPTWCTFGSLGKPSLSLIKSQGEVHTLHILHTVCSREEAALTVKQTDTSILNISRVAVSPGFTENMPYLSQFMLQRQRNHLNGVKPRVHEYCSEKDSRDRRPDDQTGVRRAENCLGIMIRRRWSYACAYFINHYTMKMWGGGGGI
jgi:hypothetical protein